MSKIDFHALLAKKLPAKANASEFFLFTQQTAIDLKPGQVHIICFSDGSELAVMHSCDLDHVINRAGIYRGNLKNKQK